MLARKIIRLGNSSYAIALPKEWIKKSELDKGDYLTVIQQTTGELTISPSVKKDSIKTKNFDFSHKNIEEIKRELFGAYIQDYNIFDIKITKEKKKLVKQLLKGVTNFEIVEETDDKIRAKDFFRLEEINVDNHVRRIEHSTQSLFDEVRNFLLSDKPSEESLAEIREIENDVDIFTALLTRIFFKGMNNPSFLINLKKDSISIFNNWWLVFNLEYIVDNLCKIAEIKKENPSLAIPEQVIKTFNAIHENYNLCMDAFYKNDKQYAVNVINKRPVLKDMSRDCMSSSNRHIKKFAENLMEIDVTIEKINKVVLYNLM
ncbi:hypothetical protein HYV49_03205 [Candidatus Pacearchaeota archaeon]|nr:hypothetical protein [Candidatus Pacearchaeota archaeon]